MNGRPATKDRACRRSDHDHRCRRRHAQTLEPWASFKSLEGQAGCREERLSLVASLVRCHPLGMLELNHGKPEGDSELAKHVLSALSAARLLCVVRAP